MTFIQWLLLTAMFISANVSGIYTGKGKDGLARVLFWVGLAAYAVLIVILKEEAACQK